MNNTLEDFIKDFGTDSMEAIVQMVVAESAGVPDGHKKMLCEMASRLSEALRDYALRNGMKKQVTDFR